ncbi:hypothetical protein PCANB_002887 [Pneumocystis canis]|nr:hypothetical protein PCANB_002887 [Pneumocystis canis]
MIVPMNWVYVLSYKIFWRNYGKFPKKDILSDFFSQGRSIIVLQKQKSKFRYNMNSLIEPLEEKSLELLSQKLICDHSNEMIDTSINEIDMMKPNYTLVSLDFFNQIIKNIEFSFNRKQIQNYARFNGLKNISCGTRNHLIVRILREVWKLEISNDIFSDIFTIKGNGFVLRQWAQCCQAKIYVDFDKLLLQVEATKSNIEKLEMKIIELTKGIKVEDIDIGYLSKFGYFSDKYILEISYLSKAFIEKIGTNKIRVIVLQNESGYLEDARKLLCMLLIDKDPRRYSLIYDNSYNNNSFYYFGEKFSLPWFMRKQEWARWKIIANKNEDNFFFKEKSAKKILENEYSIVIENGSLKSCSDVISTLYDIPRFFSNYVTYLNIKARVEYDITFGYVLHDCLLTNIYKQCSIFELRQHLENRKNDETQRIFCSNVAHTPMLIHKLKSCSKGQFLDESYKKFFKLKFVPSPWVYLNLNNSYIEIDLELDKKGNLRYTSAKHIFCESILDVLLPRCRNDLRISQKVFFFLDLNNKWLMEYLNKIRIDSVAINKLHTFSTLYIEFPSELKDIFKIQEYVLVKTEYINQVDFRLNNFLLRFLNIEGNLSTGRRTELKLLFSYHNIDDSLTVLNSQEWRDFVDDANIIVNELFKIMSTDEIRSSILGTKDYWESVFENEKKNFESFKDLGEIWFGRNLENKILHWLKNNIPPRSDLKILDVGCGNGHFLCILSNRGYNCCTLVGIDYSNTAIELSKTIAREQGINAVVFETVDILNPKGYFNGEWDIVMDKGTFDSVTLNGEVIGDMRASLLYPSCLKKLIKKGGFLIITSCNWTKEELITEFSRQEFIYYSDIERPIFSFGGSYGSSSSTVIFIRQ